MLAQHGHELRRGIVDAIDLTRLDGGHQGRRLDDELDMHLIEIGQGFAIRSHLEVLRVTFQQNKVGFLPFDELEWPGANRMPAVLFAPFLYGTAR